MVVTSLKTYDVVSFAPLKKYDRTTGEKESRAA